MSLSYGAFPYSALIFDSLLMKITGYRDKKTPEHRGSFVYPVFISSA